MTKELLEKEYEIRRLKEANKQFMNTNTILNRQNKNLSVHFEWETTKPTLICPPKDVYTLTVI